MSRFVLLICVTATASLAQTAADPAAPGSPQSKAASPIRVLLITGGCCHDYAYQTAALKQAAADRGIRIEWTVVNEGGTGTQAKIPLYDKPDWAQGFDVVIHNECFANTKDPAYVRRITAAHKAGANAVVIHCAMHTYRAAEIDDWREFLGVTSRRHEHQSRYPVKVEMANHPIMAGFPADYRTPMDELYVIEKLWPNTKVLATSPSEANGKLQPVFWTNRYGKARVFGTTYGHSNATFSDPAFLTTVIRGLRWAAGRLPQETSPQKVSQFERRDANKDGQLTRDELPAAARAGFASMDTNQNGSVSPREFRAAQRRNRQRRAPTGGLRVIRDVPYAATDNPRQALDLVLPAEKPKKPLPVVAFIHGGGWRNGSRAGGVNRLAGLVRSGRFAGVSIGYRLSGESRWPAQIHDCKAAIRWIRANAHEYGFDPDRIAVYGTSAGGHLASMLGVTGGMPEFDGSEGKHTTQSTRVQAVVNFYGPSELLTMNDHPGRMDHNAADSPEALLLGGPIQKLKPLAMAASPITHVSPDDAPMLLVHGTKDPLVPWQQSVAFLQALRKKGVEAALLTIEGGSHGGFRNPAIELRVQAFLDRCLLGRGAPIEDETLPNDVPAKNAAKESAAASTGQ